MLIKKSLKTDTQFKYRSRSS